MPGILGSWIKALGGGALFCALMLELCPKGQVKTVVKALCGIVMAIALISPLGELDMEAYSLNMAKYSLAGREIAEGGRTAAENQSRTIIEEECRAYILDKGLLMGAEIEDASVTLGWSEEGFWYPVECGIKGRFHEGLSAAVESGLGIGKTEQKWSGDENS